MRERVLRVAPEQKFFKQAHKNKEDRPEHSPTQQLLAMQRKAAEGIPAEGHNHANQY